MVRCRALLDRVDEVAVLAVADLQHDAAGAAADDRPALPEPLAHGEAEALAQRLLDHDVGDALERVDLHVPTCWMFESRWMSRSPARAASVSLPDLEALGVVGGHRAREHELRVGHLLAHDAERLDDADRVLPRVVAAHLAHDRPVRCRCRTAGVISWQNGIGELEVLHRQRVDARRRVHDVVHRRATRARTRASSTPTRRGARRTGGRTPTPSGFASVRSMWQRQIHLVSAMRHAERSREEAEHRRRLRVVDDDVVAVALEQQRVVEHLLEVDPLHRRRSTRCRRPAARCGPPW